jgi:hypothetical protein
MLFSATSCNLHIEKRRYRKGYYVELSYHHKTIPHHQIIESPERPAIEESTEMIVNKSVELKDSLVKTAIKPNEKQKPIVHRSKPKQRKKITYERGDHCDIITFTDGRQDEVIVEEITETEIKYKKCNFKEGPSYRVSKSKVKKIDMHNGEIYIPQYTNNSSKGNVNGTMITSLILAILALICVIVGAVLVFSYSGGGFFTGLIASVALAPAGILSLVGLILGATQLKKGAHPLGQAAFIANLVLQILAIIFTILMFFI